MTEVLGSGVLEHHPDHRAHIAGIAEDGDASVGRPFGHATTRSWNQDVDCVLKQRSELEPGVRVHLVTAQGRKLKQVALGSDGQDLVALDLGDLATEDRCQFVRIVGETHAKLDLAARLKRKVLERNPAVGHVAAGVAFGVVLAHDLIGRATNAVPADESFGGNIGACGRGRAACVDGESVERCLPLAGQRSIIELVAQQVCEIHQLHAEGCRLVGWPLHFDVDHRTVAVEVVECVIDAAVGVLHEEQLKGRECLGHAVTRNIDHLHDRVHVAGNRGRRGQRNRSRRNLVSVAVAVQLA